MAIEVSAEYASLAQLQHTPIDNVLHIIDRGLVHLPSYRELYYRWEHQQWSTHDIDFIPDRVQWEQLLEEEQEDYLYGLAGFFQGEVSVADALASYVLAMPDEEMRLYLTTQLFDEARHTVFFARFFKEVIGIDEGKLEDTLAVARLYMNQHMKYILVDALVEIADRLRREPQNLANLVEGVTLYHVIIEGTMALAGQRSLLELYRQNNLFPSFRGGFTAVARDESRHVIFGVKFLREMIQQDASNARIVHDTIEKYTPIALEAISPASEQIQAMMANGDDPWMTPRYAQESLGKKLKVI